MRDFPWFSVMPKKHPAFGNAGVVVPEFQLSGTGNPESLQAIRFNVEYGCSHSDAIGIVRATGVPLVVVRGGLEDPATYFIYSWNEDAAQVRVAADPQNFVPRQRVRRAYEEQLAAGYVHDAQMTG
jgi:hypothetical protein